MRIIPYYLMMFSVMLSLGRSSVKVRGEKSGNVDRIPKSIAIHPLLSSTVEHRIKWERALPMSKSGETIYITPPVESKLAVTALSQMVTEMLSSELTVPDRGVVPQR